MTWRGLTFLLACLSAFAQLPRSQAPMPREGASAPSRLDATVTDPEGRPVADLKASDFTLESGGKPQKIESVQFEQDQPLRLAVVLDDLSLPPDRLNAARRALREFVRGMREGDQAAILHAGEGSGAIDGFTSDKTALDTAIDRVRYNPASENSIPESFGAGALNAIRGALEGMREISGRKGLLLISERLGFPARRNAGGRDSQLARPAHRAATVLYAFDAAPTGQPALDQGLAAAVKDTGGRMFETGDVAAALERIARELRGYYVLTFTGDDLPFDYIARAPKLDNVTLRTGREGSVVRPRNGVLGAGDDPSGIEYGDTEREFANAAEADRLAGGIRARVTAMLSMAATWQVEAVVHVDARDITFTKGLDGLYRTRIDTATTLLDHQGKSVGDVARSFQTQLPESSFERLRTTGLDYTVVLPIPREGSYTVRSALRDASSGKIGSSRQFLRATDWKDGKLAMSSILIRGDVEKNADGLETIRDPLESIAVRSFKTGHRVTYAYNLFNLASDAEKRSEIDAQSEIWRDGVRIYAAEPRPILFPASETPSGRSVSGILAISESMPPGGYFLRVTVTDKLAKRSASQTIDFEVRQ